MHTTDHVDVVFGHALAGALAGLVTGVLLGSSGGVLHLLMLMVLCVWAGVVLGVAVVVLRYGVARRHRGTYPALRAARGPRSHPRAHPRHP